MEWEEALKKLPRKPGKDILSIRVSYWSNIHDHADKTYEDAWTLTLHTVPSFWKDAKGWKKSVYSSPMTFRGKAEDEVKQKAIEFITDAPWV